MMESEEDGENEAQIGGGRPSVESVSEFLREFKSARMSFEPLDTWLFVKARDDSNNDMESLSDANDVSASSESDSSIVYHFDSDEVSSNEDDNDDDDDDDDVVVPEVDNIPCDAVDNCDKGRDRGNTMIIENLESSPGRSGNGVKVFYEADQHVIHEDDHDASVGCNFSLRNGVVSPQKCTVNYYQGAVSNGFNLQHGSGVCSCDAREVTDKVQEIIDHHENDTYSSTDNKYYTDSYNARDLVLGKSALSPQQSSKSAVDTRSRNHNHSNQYPVNIETITRIVCDDSTAESIISDGDSNTDLSDTQKCKKKRQRIAQELLDTETTYQRHLALIVEVLNLFFFVYVARCLPVHTLSTVQVFIFELIIINNNTRTIFILLSS